MTNTTASIFCRSALALALACAAPAFADNAQATYHFEQASQSLAVP
ncbi:hypothetical protein N5D52_04915 [Pseudomonas sp. GD03860]|nr:hypothetical protein [Pseudomonas sp. GD03860]MDH0636270.1 hypothetical protein [Pseudomonas sp. GD03860]